MKRVLLIALLLIIARSAQADTPACAPDFQWQWTNPLPHGQSLYDVFGVGQLAYGVGASGTVARYNGLAWDVLQAPTNAYLLGIWMSDHDDAYCVGSGGTILHFDGDNWSTMASPVSSSLNGIWGIAADDIYVVGAGGKILHYDGIAWTEQTSGMTENLHDVWASSPTRILAVGSNGTLLRGDGVSWWPLNSKTYSDLYAIWGARPDDVWAMGDGGVTIRFQGTWELVLRPTTRDIYDIFGLHENAVFAVGSADPSPYESTLWVFDGTKWSNAPDFGRIDLRGVWGNAKDNFHVVGETGNAFHYDGTSWAPQKQGNTERINDLWMLSETDGFAVGHSGAFLRWDGEVWTQIDTGVESMFLSVWAASASDVYLTPHHSGFTSPKVMRYDGTSLFGVTTQPNDVMRAIHGSSSDHIIAVGDDGAVARLVNDIWLPARIAGEPDLEAVWVQDETFAVAVGSSSADGVVYFFDGLNWTQQATNFDLVWLNAVWGFSPNDIWVAGRNQWTLAHWNGTSWITGWQNTPQGSFYDVWGPDPDNVFVIGSSGLHDWGATGWSLSTGAPSSSHMRVHGLSECDVFVSSGWDGNLMRATAQPALSTGIDASSYGKAELWPAAPNPFNPSTTIRFTIASRAWTMLTVYDVRGRLVRTLIEGVVEPGDGVAHWDGRDDAGNQVATGIYFYRLAAQGRSLSRKMVLLK